MIALVLWTVLGIILLGYLQGSKAIDIGECSFVAQILLVIIGGPITIFLFLFGAVAGLLEVLVYIMNRRG